MLHTVVPFIPFDILNIILQYDGRIKYLHNKGIYVNILCKNDNRYNILKLCINNKIDIMHTFYRNNRLKYYIDIFYKKDEIYSGLVFSKKLLV